MKKIFSIILIAISINGLSQFPNSQGFGTATTVTNFNGAGRAHRGLINGVFTDTTTANSDHIDFYNGAQIYTRSDRNFWLRDSVLNMWIRMAKYSDVRTTLSQFVDETAWRTFYSNASGDMTGLPFGTSGKVLTSNGVSAAPTWETPSGATPTLQQVIDVNGTFNNASINVDGFNGGYIKFIQLSDPLNMEGGDNILKINRDSDAFGTEFDFSLQTALRNIKLPDYAGIFAVHPTIVGQAGKVLAVNGGETALEWITGGGGGISAADLPLRVTGSTVSADTSYDYNPSLTTNQRTQKIIDSLQAAGWGSNSVNYEPWYNYPADMSGSTQANFYAGGNRNEGIGANIKANWVGGRRLGTLTGTTGGAYLYFGNSGGYTPIAISSTHRYNFGTKINIDDVSDGTETFTVVAGLGDEANGYAANTDAIGFYYNHTVNSGNWTLFTKNNGTTTEVDSGVPVTADTDFILESTTKSGTATFFINKANVGSISSNIPDDDLARVTSAILLIKKSAGTTERTMAVEWLAIGKRSN